MANKDAEKTIRLYRSCPTCGKNLCIVVPEAGYKKWRRGKAYIQDALPEASADEREALMSGMCSACWDNFMQGEE